MQLILLKGQQGTGKTGIWGRAIVEFFEGRGKKVCYLEAASDESLSELGSAVASDSDIIIFETNLDHFPFDGFEPDFVITCEAFDSLADSV